MTSRREYEMLFQLSAELNSSFAGTFGKAQQQLLSLQKDIQELNKVQADISAYQKQQQAVENTQKKLELLQQQYDNIQKEIQETGSYSSDLENKLLSKQQQIDKTSASLEGQTQKLDQMGAKLRENGVDTDNLTKESERLGAEMADLKKKQEDAAQGAESFGNKSNQAISAVADALAAAGIAAALHEIYEAYMECVNVAGEFEASMSNVEALSGANAQEMQQLSDMAKELGATTKFTAKESADAMGYMAMAGWDAQQMLSGMPGVLSLAAASGEDLAQVSDIVTDSMTAFGLTAADTSRYADVLAATATNANTSVGIMGETFKYAAPIAGALGYSIEDTSVAIGLMANAGIKGSNAGTALRNTFNGLLSGVTLTGEAFGECTVSAVMADGTMADFGTTIDQLRYYFDQMTAAERVNNAMAIAGQRGYAGLLSILNATDEEYASLTESINNCTGTAQRMADIKMDNMLGQLTLLKSAWDAVKITVGEQFTPALQDLYSTGADVLTEVNEFLQAHPGLIKAVTAFVGVIGLGVGAITAYTTAAKLAAAANKILAASFLPGVGPILAATAGFAALVGITVALTNAQDDEAAEARKLTEASRQEQEQIAALKEEYEEAVGVYGETSDQALYLAWQIDELTASYENGKQTLAEYLAECDDFNRAMGENLDSIRGSFEEIDNEERSTLALVHRLQELASQTEQTTATQEEMKAIIKSLNEAVPDLALSYEDVISGVTDYAAAIEQAVKARAAMERYDAAQEGMVQAYNDQYEAQQRLNSIEEERAATQERYNEAQAEYQALVAEMALHDNNGSAAAKAMMSDQYKDMKAAEEALASLDVKWDETNAKLQEATQLYNDYLAELVDYVDSANSAVTVTEVIASVTEQVEALTAAYNEAYEAAFESLSGQYALWEDADTVVATSADTINSALDSQISYWNDYNANLSSLQDRTSDIEGLSDVIASFADGSSESVNAIAGMASASDEDLAAMVANWQELQAAQQETSGTIADFKTDFTNQMDELTQQLQSDIESLNMTEEAAASGMATIQAFIDSAAGMESLVYDTYSHLGAVAAAALANASGSGDGLPHYASGTEAAEPGLALVGEYGPELMIMRGGEKVIPAAQTEQYLDAIDDRPVRYADGGSYVVEFSPVYNISGSMPASDLEGVLRSHDESMRAQLEEMLRDIENDKARAAYR